MPKELKEGESKIYFATKGLVRGYFIIEEIELNCNKTLIWFNCNAWKNIDREIKTNRFQGFKYITVM
jgi:hypothetical protein